MADDEGRLSALRPSGGAISGGTARRVVQAARPEHSTADVVDLLAGVPDLREAAGRSVIVHYIGEHMGAPLLLPDLPNPKFFLYHLVLACRELPDGLQLLVDAVEFVSGQTPAVSRLRRLVSPVREYLEPADETQIKDLLAGWRVPSLARLYHAAGGNPAAPVPYRLTDAWDAFSALLDHNTSPERPSPHLVFVAMLLQTTRTWQGAGEDGWRYERIRDWLLLQIQELREDGAIAQADHLEGLRDRSERLAPDADKPIYLIIQLEPLPDLDEGRRMCRLSHWRQVHPLEWRPEPGEDRVVPLGEVPAQVGELIQEAEGGWAYQLDDALTLEFVLPLDLINLDLDQWTRDPSGMPHPRPLGAEYEILIRSRERLRTRTMHRAWRRRWRVLADAAQGSTYWAETSGPSDLRRLGDRLLSDLEAVACVLSGPPDEEPGRSELWLALRAGIPVVVWHRENDPPQEAREALRRVVGRPDLRGLPGDIKRLRGFLPPDEGEAPRADPHVALLWDDPHHFLDEADPLRAPATRN